jgi:sRNA-binding regulator protein Hfq
MAQAPVLDRPALPQTSDAQHGNGGATVGATKPPYAGVQNGWLKRRRGQPVSVRLGSGEVIAGVLVGDDTYTVELRIPGHSETALVFKHGIAYLVPAGER